MMIEMTADLHSLAQLIRGEIYDPHQLLGLHCVEEDEKTIRLWRPGATTIHLEVCGKIVEAEKIHPAGLFEYRVPSSITSADYRVYHQNGLLAHDPYAWWPTLGEIDLYLFGKGVHYELYKAMGGRLTTHQGIQGVKFAVWAPSAKQVSLIGDFNHWNGHANPMRSLGNSGVWELFVPALQKGARYKFEIKTQNNEIKVKADPMAYASELRPATASVVAAIDPSEWKDQEWLLDRARKANHSQPLNIYEVHLGSWKLGQGAFLNYRDIARELVAYCQEMGFTHVELMPIQEHPLDESWGYQVSGYYAVTSRYGTPEDFQWFVNHLHRHNLGVILDWVPGHFPSDDFSLSNFDGTALYEHADPRKGFHPHWNTLIFNFGRHEVANFLVANALYWLEEMHVDGLRVDAVASMLYLDYGREQEEWIPNAYGSKENLEAIEFLKHLNSIIHQRVPGALTIAEESTAFGGVTRPVEEGGLGFDLKWNMGWMNDTLHYFSKEMIFRNYHQRDLTFPQLYAFSERFILVLSHDEVVHGKRSLISKMAGDVWQKFANLRLLYSYMICQPGKKLLFMGGEIAQWTEWSCKRSVEWDLLQFIPHQEMQRMVRDLNHFYRDEEALWAKDFDSSGFEWASFSDTENNVICYWRKSEHSRLLCVHHFTPTFVPEYFISLPQVAAIEEVFNSDAHCYGGSGKTNSLPRLIWEGEDATGVHIQMPPLSTMVFRVLFEL
jgi:1,4-alpha-glucan branching enzyme